MMKRISITAALLSMTACSTAPLNIDRAELADARAAIADAKAAGAEKCAPKLQAEAVASLYWAAHELSETDYHPEENQQLTEDALNKAKAAKKQAKINCAPKPAPKPAPVKQEIIELKGVQFEYNSATLTRTSTAILDAAVETLVKRPDIRVEVAAHTDSTGSADYNQQLSERRAASVMAYLQEHGIDASRLTSKGYGESQPIADNSTEEGRAKNRRVELRVLK